jgi:hypothetical protein
MTEQLLAVTATCQLNWSVSALLPVYAPKRVAFLLGCTVQDGG